MRSRMVKEFEDPKKPEKFQWAVIRAACLIVTQDKVLSQDEKNQLIKMMKLDWKLAEEYLVQVGLGNPMERNEWLIAGFPDERMESMNLFAGAGDRPDAKVKDEGDDSKDDDGKTDGDQWICLDDTMAKMSL